MGSYEKGGAWIKKVEDLSSTIPSVSGLKLLGQEAMSLILSKRYQLNLPGLGIDNCK